jgi:hypothetical protein
MDHKIQFDDRAVKKLRTLAAAQPDGPLRELIGTLASGPESYPRKNAVLAEFRATLKLAKAFSPLEKESLVSSLETVLEILHIESSDGLLNEWLQGISL